jgi:hypothetical protein
MNASKITLTEENVLRLADGLRKWGALDRNEKDSAAGQALRDELRAFGDAANMLGGFDGMAALDNAVTLSGTSTAELNYLWDRIGSWMS